jgi:hypothetical protein
MHRIVVHRHISFAKPLPGDHDPPAHRSIALPFRAYRKASVINILRLILIVIPQAGAYLQDEGEWYMHALGKGKSEHQDHG